MVSELTVRASQRSVAGSVVTGGVFVLGPVKTGDHQSYFFFFNYVPVYESVHVSAGVCGGTRPQRTSSRRL